MDKPSKLNERLTLIANLSVVVGIIFLAVELQQNTQAIQAQTRDAITEKQMEYLGWRATSPELADVLAIVDSAGTIEVLNRAESHQFRAYVAAQFREWENSHYQYEQGLFTPAEYEARRQRWRSAFSDFPSREAYRSTWTTARGDFAPNFRAEIDAIVAEVSN